MAPLVRTGGSRHTGLAALPHRNIHFGMDQENGMLQVPPSQPPAVEWILFGFDSVPESQTLVSDADGVPSYRKSPVDLMFHAPLVVGKTALTAFLNQSVLLLRWYPCSFHNVYSS